MNGTSEHIDQFVEILSGHGDIILLESQKKDHPASVRSYLAAIPKRQISGKAERNFQTFEGSKTEISGNPWDCIKRFQSEVGDWIFGYFGYELKNATENLESKNRILNSLPDFYFMQPRILIEFDLDGGYRFLRGESLFRELSGRESPWKNEFKIGSKNSIKEEDYIQIVQEAKERIFEGDVYEVNYSYTATYSFLGSGAELYQRMREIGPVPFGAYLAIDGLQVCCASPERFLRRNGNKVYSQPIKGTISNSMGSDLKSLKNEKNLAENLMIVDLVRNDLGRIAKPGSVKADHLFEVQSFDSVHHLVSTVECEVSSTENSIDIIKACFPMGSMTGAPKISAMQIIDDLEDYQRGIYSGAIGYIAPNGDFDLNVVIRTAIIENEELNYPVGGAITSDSDPNDEWEETKVKTQALTKALNNFEFNE